MSSTNDDGLRTRWERLRRHGAFQAAIVFASASWLVLQAADVFGLPTAAVRVLGAVMLVGLLALGAGAWIAAGRAAAADGAGPAAATVPARRGRLRWRAAVAAAGVLLLLGLGAWWMRPRLFGAVRPGADVIAVLPFTTSGESVALLGEGLVDLLSTNLNEVGAVRTIDPRTVLHRWRQAAEGGTLDREGALRVGRTVDAGSVLLGSAVEVGGKVRLTAELLSVDGSRLAGAQEEGAADSVLVLVDRLSVTLLRDIWRAREPLPDLRLGAITTESPAALREFLRGEQFYRASVWDSARVSFERAVAQDSTFALAHMRLGEVYGWSESLGSAGAREHSQAAERFAERLPARERELVVAHRLHEQGDAAAADSLERYTARHPDDAVAFQMLGDVLLHASANLGTAPSRILETFETAQRLDPSYAPAYQHPLELALALGDSARFRRYVGARGAIEQVGGAALYDTLAALRWGPRETRLQTLGAALRQWKAPLDWNRMLGAAIAAAYAQEPPVLDDVLALFDTARSELPAGSAVRNAVELRRAQAYMLFGRFREAAPVLDSLGAVSRELALGATLPLLMGGVGPPELAARGLAYLDSAAASGRHVAVFWRAVIALMRGDAAGSRRALERATASGDGPWATTMDALRGLVAVAEGDTAGGLKQASDALRRGGYAPGPGAGANAGIVRFLLTLVEVTRPESRDRALEYLDYIVIADPNTSVLAHGVIGAAYEAAGRADDAARLHARFLRFWEGADPEVQHHVEAARRELQRLTGEGASVAAADRPPP